MHRTRNFALVLICAAALLLSFSLPSAWAQKKPDAKTKSVEKNGDALFSSATAPNPDPVFAEKVKEYTTEPYFSTELVDHLPLSDTVPSPQKVLGYVVGTPNKLTYTKDLHRYYRELDNASPRVRAFTAAEKSEEGKEQLLIAVGDESSIAKLDRYK